MGYLRYDGFALSPKSNMDGVLRWVLSGEIAFVFSFTFLGFLCVAMETSTSLWNWNLVRSDLYLVGHWDGLCSQCVIQHLN